MADKSKTRSHMKRFFFSSSQFHCISSPNQRKNIKNLRHSYRTKLVVQMSFHVGIFILEFFFLNLMRFQRRMRFLHKYPFDVHAKLDRGSKSNEIRKSHLLVHLYSDSQFRLIRFRVFLRILFIFVVCTHASSQST